MSSRSRDDPSPLSVAQVFALARAVGRELAWGRRAVAQEVRRWKLRAGGIADTTIRADAFHALTRKRGSTDGAAIFWTLLPRRNARLLKMLVTHELIWDFLDSVNERAPSKANGVQLHRAILDSLNPERPTADYYRHHPWHDDGGFLAELVASCREACRRLPSYSVARPLLLREAARAQVQGLNHLIDARRRDEALRRWAATRTEGHRDLRWFELTAAASTPLAVHALLAFAGKPHGTASDALATFDAYFPWVGLATAMLDSYVDQAEDAALGNHSYISHYRDDEEATERLAETIRRATYGVRRLPDGHRHAVIVSCMVAMYLSKTSARRGELASTTPTLARAGGSLTELLLPVLRIWRIRHGQASA